VVEGEAGFKVAVLKVTVEGTEGAGHSEGLVGNEAAGKGRDVEALNLVMSLLNLAANEEKEALEVILVTVSWATDEEVLDVGAGGLGNFSKLVGIDRAFAPANEGEAALFEDGLSGGLDLCLNRVCAVFVSSGEEKDTNAQFASGESFGVEFFSFAGKEVMRELREES